MRDHYGVFGECVGPHETLFESRRETLSLKLQMADRFNRKDLLGMSLRAQHERSRKAPQLGEKLSQKSGGHQHPSELKHKNAAAAFFLPGQHWFLYRSLHICPKTAHAHSHAHTRARAHTLSSVTRQLGSRWARCFKLDVEVMRRDTILGREFGDRIGSIV